SPVPDRAEFCATLGIDPERPIVLYLASSRGIAPEEPEFFARWLQAVRASPDEVLCSATVLLRPHPTLAKAWHAHAFDREPGVVLSPATLRDQLNSAPFREQYRAELRHATVAFGINTSGMIDAAIFGKPVCTVELPELYHGQQGTVHFEHLVGGEDSLLRTSSSLEEHVFTLGELVRRGPDERDPKSEGFISAFVRPHGLTSQPTEVFVEEMRELCAARSRLEPRSLAERSVGAATARVALAVGTPLGARHRLARNLRGRRGKRLRKKLRRHVVRLLPRPVRRAIRRTLQIP
ncbi:MAG: hypothetical protein H0W14_06880, partial [Actinobacteria bacterium]|nr:hypothetical protein [Actinomycetota bacterium]